MRTSATNSIVETVTIEAPIERVWRAISDSREFGEWFGMACDRPFAAGAEVGCEITEPEEYRGTKFAIWIERVEPPNALAFRWHPYEVAEADFSTAPTTLVSFTLEARGTATLVTIEESGFDDIPLDRRAEAFSSNSEGWRIQAQNIAGYVATHA